MNVKSAITTLILAGIIIGGGIWLFTDDSVKVSKKTDSTEDSSSKTESGHEGEDADPVISESGPYPKVFVEETEFDFGVMGDKEVRSHDFIIKNEGEVPLVLAKGKTTCQCTLSNLNQNSIPPGESSKVTLTWEPKKPSKIFRHTAKIKTNDPEQSVIKFIVIGAVVPLLMTDPPSDWDLGYFTENKEETFEGRVYSQSAKKMEIVEKRSSTESIKAVLTPLSEKELSPLEASSGYKIKFDISSNIKVGSIREYLYLKMKVNEKELTFRIELKGIKVGPIRIVRIAKGRVKWIADKLLLNMGTFPAKDGLSLTMPMYIVGMEEDFKVLETKSNLDFVNISIKKSENNEDNPDDSTQELVNSTTKSKPLDIDNVVKNALNPKDKENKTKKDDDKKTNKTKFKNQRFDITFEVKPGMIPTSRVFEEAVKINLKTNHPNMKEVEFKVGFISI